MGWTFVYSLFSYIIAYKVIIGYTPYQLVYGLPKEYIVPFTSGNDRDNIPLKF